MTPPSTERATRRRQQLHEQYTNGPLELLTEMYRDRDWAVLTAPDGKPFRTFTAFVAHDLDCSDAYARRCQQTIRRLILPIAEIAGLAATSAITMSDMEILGNPGATLLLDRLTTNPLPADNPGPALRAHIAAAAKLRNATAEEPADIPPPRSAAATAIAAAVPTTRAHPTDDNNAPPWNTNDQPPPHATEPKPAAAHHKTPPTPAPTAPHDNDALSAALETILAADHQTAAAHLHHRITDLTQAALALTHIRAHALQLAHP